MTNRKLVTWSAGKNRIAELKPSSVLANELIYIYIYIHTGASQ